MKKSFCDRCGKEMSPNIWERYVEYVVTNYPVTSPYEDMCEKCVKEVCNIIRSNQGKIKKFKEKQGTEMKNFIKKMLDLKRTDDEKKED